MTRVEALAFVVAPIPPGMARKIVRETLLGWPEVDVVAWHRMKDNERKAAKRDAVRSMRTEETGQVPVLVEGHDRTSSGLNESSKPDPSPSPQVSPTPPSSPTPTPTPSPAYTREERDALALIPVSLRSDAFAAEWLAWLVHCRDHAVSRQKTYTPFTQRQQLAELERMGPEKALRAVQVSGSKGSASIIDPDEQRFGNVNGTNPHRGNTRHPAPTTIPDPKPASELRQVEY